MDDAEHTQGELPSDDARGARGGRPGGERPRDGETSPVPSLAAHLRAAGAIPVLIAAHVRAGRGWHRSRPIRRGDGRRPAADAARCPVAGRRGRGLDTYLVTVADHGFNASTFTARVIASTRAGIVSAVPGASRAARVRCTAARRGRCSTCSTQIGAPATPGLDRGALARGERLMGFGHRVYKVRDPRADVLRAVAAEALPRRRRRPPGAGPGRWRPRRSLLREHKPGPPAGHQRRVLHRAAAAAASACRPRRSRRASPSAASPAGSPTPCEQQPAAG